MSSVLQTIRQAYLAQQQSPEETQVPIVAYVRRGGRGASTGNPTGSAAGKCTAQLQLLRFPGISEPTPFPLRSLMVFESGNMTEAWWAHAIEAAFPALSGLANELFYFPVPLEGADLQKLVGKIPEPYTKRRPGQIWGEVEADFQPPTIAMDPTRNRPRISRLIERESRGLKVREARLAALPRGLYEETLKAGVKPAVAEALLGLPPARPRPRGFIVDPGASCVWVPTYVDRILLHPEHGLGVLEKKAVSTPIFRRALLGQIGFEMKAQLVTFVQATHLPVSWLLFRKETAHLLEIYYEAPKPGADARTRVTMTKPNGSQEVYWVDGESLINAEGATVDVPGDLAWETAETWTPYDTDLLEQIHDNIRRVLLLDGPQEGQAAPWLAEQVHRRYGPSFECRTCQGTGLQTLNKTTREPLKKAKPCEDCPKGADGKASGILDRAQLPVFPCGYCPVIGKCWGEAGYTVEITDKPKHFVTRAAFEQSGIVVTPFAKLTAVPTDEAEAIVS